MRNKWWALVAVAMAVFMLLLDITIVNVALPNIERELDASFADLQWVIDAYALSLAALLLTWGSLADLFGRRLVFSLGLVIFTIASVGCALAAEPWQLIAGRAVQGIGGAMMFATSLAIVAVTFHGRDRGVAFGVVGATTGLAVAVGPTVGGALTSGAGWEWIFLVNVPIGMLALALTLTQVAESKQPHEGAVDWPGLVTFSVALFSLVLALIQAPEWGWGDSRVVGLFVTSAVLLAVFVAFEMRVRHPMFDLTLLRNRTFLGAGIVAFTLSASMFAMFLFLVLYMQNILGYDALETGLRFLPLSGISFFAAGASGRLTEVLPAKVLMGTGMLLVSGALALMTLAGAGDDWTALVPGFLVGGIGIGMVNPSLASTAVGVVEPHRSGMASGISSTFRQVGIATGIAGLGAIFRHQMQGDGHVDATGTIDNLSPTVRANLEPAFIDAMHDVMWVATAVALAGALAAWLLLRQRDILAHHGPPAAAVEG